MEYSDDCEVFEEGGANEAVVGDGERESVR